MNWSFHGRTAIVTGGGRGIGQAVALSLARLGSRVAVLDVDYQAACATASKGKDLAGALTPWHCDVASEKSVAETVARIARNFEVFDFLFNNAGINIRKPLGEWTAADWERMISVNLIGSFCVARSVGGYMVDRRKGSIVNVSALGGGVIGLGRGSEIYAATKGAIAGMSRDFAAEWAPFGVRVNCIAPGWIETEMNASLLQNRNISQKVIERVPLGRWGTVDDVVGPVLFLASDYSGYITGQILPIDGGAASAIRLTDETSNSQANTR
jgi:NAD(P)-dependent dehydrogenase (short-subunit alcohol dehydrogenase family)